MSQPLGRVPQLPLDPSKEASVSTQGQGFAKSMEMLSFANLTSLKTRCFSPPQMQRFNAEAQAL